MQSCVIMLYHTERGWEPDVCAFVMFYNDGPAMLRRCLASLRGLDRVYAVDGRFRGHAGPSALSTDGCREVCAEFENVELVDAPDSSISEKSAAVFNRISDPFTVCLMIDADMYAETDDGFATLRQACRKRSSFRNGTARVRGEIKHWNRSSASRYRTCMILNPALVYQSDKWHWIWLHTYTRREAVSEVHIVPGVTLIHDDSGRTRETADINATYHDRLNADELVHPPRASLWGALVVEPGLHGYSSGRGMTHPAWHVTAASVLARKALKFAGRGMRRASS